MESGSGLREVQRARGSVAVAVEAGRQAGFCGANQSLVGDSPAAGTGDGFEEVGLISIVNVKALDDDPLGEHLYEVLINAKVKATFRHRRSNGLVACLRASADAVEENPHAIVGNLSQKGG